LKPNRLIAAATERSKTLLAPIRAEDGDDVAQAVEIGAVDDRAAPALLSGERINRRVEPHEKGPATQNS
jgi:hypothetical protein